jgi:tocopherol O-methyltransferase
MIRPKTTISSADVARHYDELDVLYRDAWGEHVHHGYWTDDEDDRPISDATRALVRLISEPLHLRPGERIVDIGSGYGAVSRMLAHDHQAHLTALTLSEKQTAHARLAPRPTRGTVDYLTGDWLTNKLPASSYDAAIAIECLSHMENPRRFFEELFRTLKPGGRASISDWTVAAALSRVERRLIRDMSTDGQLVGIGTLEEYLDMAKSFGLVIQSSRDISRQVERTWWLIAKQTVVATLTKVHFMRFILTRAFRKPLYLLTLPRLLLAYRTGALRYVFFSVRKPAG